MTDQEEYYTDDSFDDDEVKEEYENISELGILTAAPSTNIPPNKKYPAQSTLSSSNVSLKEQCEDYGEDDLYEVPNESQILPPRMAKTSSQSLNASQGLQGQQRSRNQQGFQSSTGAHGIRGPQGNPVRTEPRGVDWDKRPPPLPSSNRVPKPPPGELQQSPSVKCGNRNEERRNSEDSDRSSERSFTSDQPKRLPPMPAAPLLLHRNSEARDSPGNSTKNSPVTSTRDSPSTQSWGPQECERSSSSGFREPWIEELEDEVQCIYDTTSRYAGQPIRKDLDRAKIPSQGHSNHQIQGHNLRHGQGQSQGQWQGGGQNGRSLDVKSQTAEDSDEDSVICEYLPESEWAPPSDRTVSQDKRFDKQSEAGNSRALPNGIFSEMKQTGAFATNSEKRLLSSTKSAIGETQHHPILSPKEILVSRTQSSVASSVGRNETSSILQSKPSNSASTSSKNGQVLKPPNKALPKTPEVPPSRVTGNGSPKSRTGDLVLIRNNKSMAGNNVDRNSDLSGSSYTSSSAASSSSGGEVQRHKKPSPCLTPARAPPSVIPQSSLAGNRVNGVNHTDSAEERLCGYPWYRGDMSRTEAEERVKFCGKDGAFLVRKSTQGDNSPHPYTICVLSNGAAYHIHIRRRFIDQKYAVGTEKVHEIKFDTIEELIKFYGNNALTVSNKGRVVGEVCLDASVTV